MMRHTRPGVPAGGKVLFLVVSLAAFFPATAEDWPQYLGPRRDGTSTESVREDWGPRGPRVLSSLEVGSGFSGPVVAEGRVLLHHRRGNDSILECWDVTSPRESRWRHVEPTRYHDDFGFDNGPRAVPAIANGRVHAFGADGMLTCVDFATGKALWSVDTAKKFGAGKGYFGFACSPLVHEGLVLLNIGGRDKAGIVAFDATTGEVRWKATDHEAGYSSPVIMSLGGVSNAVFFTREGLVVLDSRTGTVREEYSWRASMAASVNAATPLVLGERVFLSASYGTGAVLLDLRAPKSQSQSQSPSKPQPQRKPVWSGDESLSSHYASVVHHDGYLFGFHGRQEYGASLRCVDAATGKVAWSEEGLGSGSVLVARDRLLVLTERGELILARATPARFEELARAQVLGSGCRAYPALSQGRWWGRDTGKLICLELGPVP